MEKHGEANVKILISAAIGTMIAFYSAVVPKRRRAFPADRNRAVSSSLRQDHPGEELAIPRRATDRRFNPSGALETEAARVVENPA